MKKYTLIPSSGENYIYNFKGQKTKIKIFKTNYGYGAKIIESDFSFDADWYDVWKTHKGKTKKEVLNKVKQTIRETYYAWSS